MVLGSAVLLLAACSVGRLAYNNASPVVTYMVDDYFDLSGDQEDWVRTRFSRLQAWHRETELPTYERDLLEAVRRTERPLTLEDARWVNKTLRSYYDRAVEQALPDMAELLLQLDTEQARHFERRFAKESLKIEKETARGTAEERAERRAEKMIDQIETYTGRLSREQRALVAQDVRTMVDVAYMRLADRIVRQELIVALVQAKPPKAELVAGLRRVLMQTESWRKPEYTQALARRDEQVADMMVALSHTWTPEQRASVQRKLRAYLNDVSSLIAVR
ncbi:hypothetical protein BWI17_12215 [Betaproteobacteria bacterium GR16-43]|nr:hypothetical protein BWI17_12215 [Betaproteobacteria bacterium GR16-43]